MSKRMGWKKITALLLSGLLVVYLMVAVLFAMISNGMDVSGGQLAENGSDWMADIPDGESLAQVSIPGTHDTTTKYSPYHYSFQCQGTTTSEQLAMGYRFMDIRIKLSEEGDHTAMYLMHGFGHCRKEDNSYLTFQDFEADCLTFLEEHPTETIIVMIDAAMDREKNASAVAKAVQEEIAANSSWYTQNRIPTMGEVRGRLILATRYGDVNGVGQDLCGWDLEWDSQSTRGIPETAVVNYALNETGDSFNVQNWYKVLPDTKWQQFSEAMDGDYTDSHTLLLNFLTISRGYLFLPCPRMRAMDLNQRFSNVTLTAGKSYGIVILDFGNSAMAEKIYETNFQ